KGTHIIDTHDAPVIDEVLTLYQYVVQKAGRIPNTMIEWDDAIPEFPVLFAELDKARHAAKMAPQHGALPQLAQGGEHYIANRPTPLHEAQHRMQAAIFLGKDPEEKPDSWIRAKPDFAPAEQLEVYTNSYRWRLYDVVADDYPVLKHYYGKEDYSNMVTDFIETIPSQHFNISRYAALLPAYLITHRPDDRFACQLGELESAISQLTDPEETIALAVEHLQGLTPEILLETVLYPRKALQLFAFDYPLNDYYIAVKEEQNPAKPELQKSWLAIFRHEHTVWRMALEKDEYLLLSELFSGTPIGAALEKIGAEIGDIENLAPKLFHWFSRWQRNGLLSANEWIKNKTIRGAA
ncbi:MAG: DUF692 family protein, partial [Alphaproteobacteria bacterium]|nr:DUF692 family protein [Alphaproteobacteria bacterium]